MKYLILLLFLGACGVPPDQCYINHYQNITNYEVNPNTTIAGVMVDDGSFDFDREILADRILAIEECLVGAAGPLDPKEKEEGRCLKDSLEPLPFKRDCLVIKIVESVYSPCSPNEGFLPVEAPQALCEEKGLEADPNCPCRWRTAIQDDNVLIVPLESAERMNLWDLTRIWSGCNNQWKVTNLTKCAGL